MPWLHDINHPQIETSIFRALVLVLALSILSYRWHYFVLQLAEHLGREGAVKVEKHLHGVAAGERSARETVRDGVSGVQWHIVVLCCVVLCCCLVFSSSLLFAINPLCQLSLRLESPKAQKSPLLQLSFPPRLFLYFSLRHAPLRQRHNAQNTATPTFTPTPTHTHLLTT